MIQRTPAIHLKAKLLAIAFWTNFYYFMKNIIYYFIGAIN